MPETRLCLHCDVAGDRNASLEFTRNSRSGYVYFLNPDTEAIDVALALGKEVGVRWFDPFGDYQGGRYKNFDNDFHHLHSPDDTFNLLVNSAYAKYRNNPRVKFILGINEPTANSTDDIRASIIWAAAWGKICATNGFGALLGGFAIAKSLRLINNGDGTASAPDVDAGIWDVLLKVAHDYSEWLTIDIHVYWPFRYWFQFVGDPYNKELMLNPPPDAQVIRDYAPNGKYPPYWYVGRETPLILRKDKMGYYKAMFGLGETGYDNTDDIADTINKVAADFTRPEQPFPSHKIRGVRSLRRLFAFWNGIEDSQYTDVMFANDAFKCLIELAKQYPKEHFRYMAFFAGNSGSDWVTYNLFAPEMKAFLNRLALYIEEDTPMTFKDALVASTSEQGTNLRDAPNGGVVSKLGLSPLRVQVSEGVQFVGSYNWRIIIIDGQELYAADKFIVVSEIVPPIPPPDLPEDIEGLIELAVQKWINEEFDNELYLHISADGSASHAVLRSTTFILQALLDIIKVELAKGAAETVSQMANDVDSSVTANSVPKEAVT